MAFPVLFGCFCSYRWRFLVLFGVSGTVAAFLVPVGVSGYCWCFWYSLAFPVLLVFLVLSWRFWSELYLNHYLNYYCLNYVLVDVTVTLLFIDELFSSFIGAFTSSSSSVVTLFSVAPPGSGSL